MKRIILAFLLISVAFLAACSGIKASPLTLEQKEADFRYLTDLVEKTYPFLEVNSTAKGLEDLGSLSRSYIQRAKETPDDAAYLALFNEYLSRLGQTGHAYLIKPAHLEYLKSLSSNYIDYYNTFTDMKKVPLDRITYWSKLDDSLPKPGFFTAEINVDYIDGKYTVARDTVLISSGKTIPQGSIVETVDGKPVDDSVRLLETKVRLSFDPEQNRLYLPNPLLLPSSSSNNWRVGFRTPDGNRMNEVVSISQSGGLGLDQTYPNVVPVELTQDTGYIRIFGMGIGTGDRQKDKEAIASFITRSQGRYQKLIVDVRGNNGGDPGFWMDILVAPLAQEPIRYTQTAALRQGFISYWGSHLQRYLTSNQGLLSEQLHFKGVTQIASPPYFDPSWQVFEVTREILPQNRLPFNGQIFVLADEGSFSASEDFVLFCKQTGFAKIIGTRTGGGAAAMLLSHVFALPESGILFCVEMEAALNPDGTFNEIAGTAPDILMHSRTDLYSYKPKALLEDSWIQAVLAQP